MNDGEALGKDATLGVRDGLPTFPNGNEPDIGPCARKGVFRYNGRVVMESQVGVFRCRRCGACCRVPGYVRVSDEDVVALAGLLGMTPEAFAEEHTELSPGRTGLVLKGRPEAPCRFLTAENLCRVHAARPRQCRDYPARWRSADIEAVCRAARSEEWI